MPLAPKWCILGYGYYRTLIGIPILEVEFTGHRGHMATGRDQNGNEATG